MPRITQQELTGLAFRILDNAVAASVAGKVPRTVAIRFALAYLASLADGDRGPFDAFWQALQLSHVMPRQIELKRALLSIRHQLGEIDDRQYMAGRVALPVETKKGYRWTTAGRLGVLERISEFSRAIWGY